jgi:NAD(P)-dependent dehydrogenase (short-subunit alcohol dehydrogenase family)
MPSVTSRSRGIGAAIAIYLVNKGAEGVAITYVGNKTAAEKIAAEVMALGSRAASSRPIFYPTTTARWSSKVPFRA